MTAVRVVVADDTPDVRALLRLMLGQAGCEIVGEAANGSEAVALAEEHQPDVVIVDLGMPGMDGLEAIPLIRRQAPAAKIVVFSGFSSERVEADALAAGAHAFLEKGAPPAQLVATVSGLTTGSETVEPRAEQELLAPSTHEDVSFVIHELMTPITVIEGFATMIDARADTLPAEDIRDYGRRIARSATHLRTLIQAMSDARKVEGGSLQVERELLDVGVLVPQIVGDLDDITTPHPVLVESAPGFVVRGDGGRIRQVLTNLLSNAAKFSAPGDPIMVTVAGADGVVEVSVRDHGPGVPLARREELFGRYARLDSGAPGMGIGLYISRGIARAHGGELRLAESAPGAGACFVLSLPAADAAEPTDSEG